MSYWESVYRSGDVPWDPGPYDGHLPSILESCSIAPSRAADIGCGTGGSLIYLAERGFSCTGIDLSPSAIDIARTNADRRGVECRWLVGHFPEHFSRQELPDAAFPFIMERGFLQHLVSPRRHRPVLERIRDMLTDDGIFYSLITKREGASSFWGPPRWSEAEVRAALEPCFTVLELRPSVFTPGEPGSIPAWVCILQKKAPYP